MKSRIPRYVGTLKGKGKNIPKQPDEELPDKNQSVAPNQINYSLISLWVSYCEQHHGIDCNRRELERSAYEEVDIILVDVRKNCLVQATTKARYIALSYVWGAVSQLQTTRELFSSLMTPESLREHEAAIPPVISDAILFVRSLGEPYLWVDSLCIVQDDANAKHHQITQMAVIYSSSLFTIVAIAARDANSSLPGVRPHTRWVRSAMPQQCELHVPLRPDLVIKAMDRSLYASRGWTFQERILSRRCVYFLDEQLYFHCRGALWCEEPQPIKMTRIVTNSAEYEIHPMARAYELTDSIKRKDWSAAFRLFANLILEYSRKNLSFPHDVIDAFSGVLEALQGYSNFTFTYGLPEELIDWALMWAPSHEIQRRPSTSPSLSHYFPTWSWVGWVGGMDFNFAFDFELRDLRSAVTMFEIQDITQPTGFRPVNRLLTGKLSKNRGFKDANINFDESGYCNDYNYSSLTREASLPGSALRFVASVVSMNILQARDMLPWWRDQENGLRYADKRAEEARSGVWLTGLNDDGPQSANIYGFLYGFSRAKLERRPLKALHIALISHTNDSPYLRFIGKGSGYLGSRSGEEHTNSHDYLSLKATLDISSRTGDEAIWKVGNILLLEKKGSYFERVTIGHVYRRLWSSLSPQDQTIILV